MSVSDRRRLPTGRNFDLAEGLDANLVVAIRDNAGADLDLTKISASSWKMQPSRTDPTGAIEKTMGSGVTFALQGTTVYATIAIDGADTVGKVGAASRLNWVQRLQVTYDGEPFLAMSGNVRIWKGW